MVWCSEGWGLHRVNWGPTTPARSRQPGGHQAGSVGIGHLPGDGDEPRDLTEQSSQKAQ